jgi:curved DNA-binding protein CbpA
MSSTNPDHYETLNVSQSASQRDIAKAYRALMRTHHPDVGPGATVDPGELLRIMQAFAVLRDPTSRAAYDDSLLRTTARPRQNDPAPRAAPRPAPRTQQVPRDVPVRRVRSEDPPLRVSPVHWESGPWAGYNNRRKERPNP